MKLVKNNIYIEDTDAYNVTDDNGVTFRPTDAQQREIIAFYWKHKPEMAREIVCEECPEHIETRNYLLNKRENGTND